MVLSFLGVVTLFRSDEIRTTPEKLEKMMSNKHVLGAAGLLVQSLKTVNSKELKQIGALDDLRRTLTAMKNVSYYPLD